MHGFSKDGLLANAWKESLPVLHDPPMLIPFSCNKNQQDKEAMKGVMRSNKEAIMGVMGGNKEAMRG